MELEDKLSELNLTEEETGRLTKAFKDETFRKMLRDYVEEISDPENRKKYEEEIAILERDRGNSVEFIHPTPFKCLRTSVNGKNKCYVNICANDKIGKPSCKSGLSEDGKNGHHWSLPHSIHPERKELNPKGNKILIYDVIFHPDTLHMASTNSRFMDMVTSAAVQNFRCSRDSTQSPRPKEIILTVDLPLLKSVAAVSLEVKEKSLLLESQNPAYKLELSLAYAVDEDKGEAKFNRQTKQLVVTLPVQPLEEGLQINSCPQGLLMTRKILLSSLRAQVTWKRTTQVTLQNHRSLTRHVKAKTKSINIRRAQM
ncbi:hypothetical protein WMY93_016950 [Mugilogobius chulae]|uniref:PIH1 N-terminal domain-containing protein n=1 Tax=Mugilogobius chulae TaxID=88201 RepID=A0AAW0NN28_9GOBI